MVIKQSKALAIGSGQGGTPLTMALAAAGHDVALSETSPIEHLLLLNRRSLHVATFPPSLGTTTNRLLPYTVFIDPKLGRIGLTEAEAKVQGKKVRVAKMPMAWVARALEIDESRGFMKVLVDGESDQIVGAAILGIDGGEVMSMLQIAMMGSLPYTSLKDGAFAHPIIGRKSE